jgi:hypothetical protein
MAPERNGSEVAFTFFDRERYLRFGFDEYLELERATGRSPMEFVRNLLNMSPADMRTALWIGLKWEDRKVVTQDWVQAQLAKHMAKRTGMVAIIKRLDEAFTASGYFATDRAEDGDGTAPLDQPSASRSTPPSGSE